MADTSMQVDQSRLDAFDDLPMRVGWGSYRRLSDELIAYVSQLGIGDLTLTPWRYEEFESSMPTGEGWSFEEITQVRDMIERHGLRLYAFETLPIPLYDILTAEPDVRYEYIEEIESTVRNMGRAGVPVLGYSGHHPKGVGRTTRNYPVRGGAEATAFDRADIEEDDLILDREYSEAELWDTYEEFLENVLPVAESAGVTLAVHPSDPPLEKLGGLPMLFRNRENFRRAMDLVPSDHHGIKLGMGCWSEMGEDLPDVIETFADDLVYVHFRDVVGTAPTFYETFIDDPDSNYDEFEVIKTLHDVGFTGVMLPDHVPMMVGDENWEYGGIRGRTYTVGYLKGMLRALQSAPG